MNYLKAVAAIVATVLAGLIGTLHDGVSTSEWLNVIVLGAGAAAVLAAPNVPGSRYTKAVLSVLTTVSVLLVSLVGAGNLASLSADQWLQVAVAALGAVGVLAVPNKPNKQVQASSGE